MRFAGFERIHRGSWLHGYHWTGWAPEGFLEVVRVEVGKWDVWAGNTDLAIGVSFQRARAIAIDYAVHRCES